MELGLQLAEGNNNLQANYVVVGDIVYCLQVTDPAKAKAFAAANPIPKGTSMFAEDTPAGGYWETGAIRMGALKEYDRDCATMAYVLSRADAGIMLLRKTKNQTTFEALGVAKDAKNNYYPTRCQ